MPETESITWAFQVGDKLHANYLDAASTSQPWVYVKQRMHAEGDGVHGNYYICTTHVNPENELTFAEDDLTDPNAA